MRTSPCLLLFSCIPLSEGHALPVEVSESELGGSSMSLLSRTFVWTFVFCVKQALRQCRIAAHCDCQVLGPAQPFQCWEAPEGHAFILADLHRGTLY